MELKFNNIEEIIDFLKEIGYNVTKSEVTTEDIEKNDKESLEDWWKKIPQNPYPYNPYCPPYSPYPIVTLDTLQDPNLSSKFGTCKK